MNSQYRNTSQFNQNMNYRQTYNQIPIDPRLRNPSRIPQNTYGQ
jgi:hypothetical protein